MKKEFFCKDRHGKREKDWTLSLDKNTGEIVLKNHKPHLMGEKAGLPFRAYATQRICFSQKRTKYDMKEVFEKSPDLRIEILDMEQGKKFVSRGSDWTKHGRIANYGDGEQIFLGINYMEK